MSDPDQKPDESIEVTVGGVAHGGWCVARHDGRVVFVRHALPGERVRAEVVERTARFWRADAVEVLEPSADRVTPPCPYAGPGRCGGCDWQHATPAAGRQLKSAVVEEQLRRIAGIERTVPVEELPGHADGLGWRTRVRFAVDESGAVGLRRHRSHQIQPIDHCPLAHPEVERLGVERRRWRRIDEVTVVGSATGDRLVLLDDSRAAVPRLDAPVRVVRGSPAVGSALPYVRERAAGRTWRVSGNAFWQVHPAAADVLSEAVVDALRPEPGESVLDLYCGVGLFAGVLAERVGTDGQVTGLESDPVAVRDARHNLADLPQVTIVRGRIERLGERASAETRHAADHPRAKAESNAPMSTERARDVEPVHLTVVDPPRTGLGAAVVRTIAGRTRRRIAYVSCDPATLARDLRTFVEHGWRLTGLRGFDAFPMTHHVECVAALDKQ